MASNDDLALVLIRLDLSQGKIVNQFTYPSVSFAQARRIVRLDSDLDLIWWTAKQPPFIDWRIVEI